MSDVLGSSVLFYPHLGCPERPGGVPMPDTLADGCPDTLLTCLLSPLWPEVFLGPIYPLKSSEI